MKIKFINKISKWLNDCSNVEHKSIKISPIRSMIGISLFITLFCYAFTYSYYGWFGINYFLNFEYSDIYNFTLARISVFFTILLLISFLPITFLGFFIVKDKCENYFSNFQLWILRLSFLLPTISFVLLFVYEYTGSVKQVTVTILILLLIGTSLYKQIKSSHDIFLIVLLIITPILGMVLGKTFAEDRFNSTNRIELVDGSKKQKILNQDQIVIGQNKTSFIVLNKKDTICDIIPKSSNIIISLKGKLGLN
ncbi:MAG: hypothetical protein H6604_03910 [Flavobacteriales bacterium]|nr:hypothetical protein [Flavobacteriales bacterium]